MTFHWIWFLNGIGLAAIALMSFYCFFVWYKNKCACKVGNVIGINGILYFMYSLLTLLWSFEIIKPIRSDFILIEGVFNVIKATLFVVIIYYFINNKNLLYFLFLFLLTTLAIYYSINTFFLVVSLASYAIIAVASFDLFLLANKYLKKAGIFSLIYSVISISLLVFIYMNKDPSRIMWFIPNIIMFVIFILFLFDIKHCGSRQEKAFKPKIKKVIIPLLFIKFIIFISAITLFLLVSTIAIHELGHSLAAQYYGCEKSKAVIYDITDSAHTEMICRGYYNDTIITLAGVLFPIVVGLIFLLTGGSFTTNIAYLIFGFSFIIPSRDLEVLNISQSIIFLVIMSGVAFLIYGVIRLSVNYVKQKGGLSTERKILEEAKFWIDEKTPVKDLYDLVDEVHEMSNFKFRQFIKNRKKELLKWIKDVLKEKHLARELAKIEDKKETLVIVMNHLLKTEAEYDQNIFKYLCYPVLKEKVKKIKGKNANRSSSQNQS